MPTKLIKKNKTVKSTKKRITFTFSATEDLVYIINKLELRLKGLNKSEIAKLALIELDNTLEIRNRNIEYVEHLSIENDKAILDSYNSKKTIVDNSEDLLLSLKK